MCSRLTLTLLSWMVATISFSQETEERYNTTPSPINTLETPSSYAHFDHYKVAKEKNALVYGRDYIFEGHSAGDVDSTLINQVDPYSYLNQFRDFENVIVEVEEMNLTMILFARKVKRGKILNETE